MSFLKTLLIIILWGRKGPHRLVSPFISICWELVTRVIISLAFTVTLIFFLFIMKFIKKFICTIHFYPSSLSLLFYFNQMKVKPFRKRAKKSPQESSQQTCSMFRNKKGCPISLDWTPFFKVVFFSEYVKKSPLACF